MARLPFRTVRVGGVRVRLQRLPCGDRHAFYNYETRVIELDPETADDPEKLVRWVRHEITHAAIHVSGLSGLLTERQEEAFVRMCDEILWPAWEAFHDRLKPRKSRSRRRR